jgi:hypothetical protein
MNAKISQSGRSSPLKRMYATVRLTRVNIRSAGGSPPRRDVRTQPGVLTPGNMLQTVRPESGARLFGPKGIVRFTPAALDLVPLQGTSHWNDLPRNPELSTLPPSGDGLRAFLYVPLGQLSDASGSARTTMSRARGFRTQGGLN